nr:unnamed protein product [Callosobruchus chinensis]
MYNYKTTYYNFLQVVEQEWGPIKTSHGAGKVVVTVNEKRYLCIFEDGEPEPIIKRINNGSIGGLDFVKYLQYHDLIFVASGFEFLIMKRRDEEHYCYCASDLDIRAVEWNPTETGFVACTGKKEVLYFTFKRTSLTLQSRCSLDSVPICAVLNSGSEDTQFQGAGAERPRAEGTNTSPLIEEIDGRGDHFAVNYLKNNKRYVRVFNILLEPLYESESYPNLGPTVSFAEHCQSIACFAVDQGGNKIVIFEQNCRVKEDFYVPQTKNNKWCLKQELYYPTGINVYDFFLVRTEETEETKSTKLAVVTDKYIAWQTLKPVIYRSPHEATVVVIDGKFLEFSKFDQCITPQYCYYASRPINEIYFNLNSKLFMIIDSHFQTTIFDYSGEDIHRVFVSKDPKLTSIANIKYVDWTDNDFVKITIDTDINSIIDHEDNCFRQTCITKKFNAAANPPDNSNSENLPRGIVQRNVYEMKTASGTLTYRVYRTTRNNLYVDDKIVCRGVTGYCIYKSYLLFTHLDSHFYTVRLRDAAIFEREFNLEKFFRRPLEQGTEILGVLECLPPQVIIYQEIGNRAVIKRAILTHLTIDYIEELVNEGKWSIAMQVMRNERINWNVLIELNPDKVLSSIEEFAIAARGTELLVFILHKLNVEECVLNTIYKKLMLPPVDVPTSVKLSFIDAILTYVLDADYADCAQCFVTIFNIQRKHTSLKTVVASIRKMFVTVERHRRLCYILLRGILVSDPFRLVLDAAYNLHDLQFVLFVYRCSSEDPRVYEQEIVELKRLNNMDHLKFVMCLKGNNPKEAVKYLMRCDEFDADFIENFIMRSKVEKEAYNTVDSSHVYYFHISRLYAKALSKEHKYQEAALVYMRAGWYKEALDEYILDLDWREVIRLMAVLNYDDEVKPKVLDKIADRLIEEKRVDDAVILLEHYNKDYKKTIKTLIDIKAFRQAVCLAERLSLDVELRNARSRRKLERQKIDLKEGGKYEDIALIRALHILYTQVFQYGGEVREICLFTPQANYVETRPIHDMLNDLQKDMKQKVNDIWPAVFIENQLTTDPVVMAILQNREDLDPKYREPPLNLMNTLYYNFLQVAEHELGPIKTSHGAGKVVVTAHENRYLCIFEDGKPEPSIHSINNRVRQLGLDFVKYLPYQDLIFVACDSVVVIIKRGDEGYAHAEIDDIRAVEWNPTETGFVVCTGKNEVLYFTINRTSLSLQSRCSLDSAVPIRVGRYSGSEDTQFQGAGAERRGAEGTHTSLIEEINGRGDHFAVNYLKNNKRYVRVFNILLEPLYESESYPNLGPTVSFAEHCQSIACFAVDQGRNKIVIFEQNCRVKEDFYVPQTKRSTVVIGRPAIVRTVQMEEAVLNEIERNPESSTRKIAHELNITHVTVWQILRYQQSVLTQPKASISEQRSVASYTSVTNRVSRIASPISPTTLSPATACVVEYCQLHCLSNGTIKKVRFVNRSFTVAVFSEDLRNKEEYITLYFKENNKWYLKQELYYPAGINVYDFFLVRTEETEETQSTKLAVVTDKYIAWQTLKPVIYRSPHEATVVAIDGKFLEFSKFDQCITPQPCSYTQVEHSRPINEIYFNLNSKLCMIIDSHFQTTIFDYSGEDIHPVFVSKDPKLTSIANIKYVDWTDNDFVKITIDTDSNSIIDHEDNCFRQTCITKNSMLLPIHQIIQIVKIYRVTLFKEMTASGLSNYRICATISAANPPDNSNSEKLARDIVQRHLYKMKTASGTLTYRVYQTTRNNLYVDDKIVCRGVTGYCIYKSYLLFTHLDSHLYTVRLRDAAIFEREFNLEKFFRRPLEQGTEMLGVSECLPPKVILYQEIGNRAVIGSAILTNLTIDDIEELVNEGKWSTAMQVMRNEGINWNVLIELNPDKVLSSIEEFVIAARGTKLLIAILQDLDVKECVLNTIYKDLMLPPVDVPTSVKLSFIDAILTYVLDADYADCAQCFVTIFNIQRKHTSLKTVVASIQKMYVTVEGNRLICKDVLRTVLVSHPFRSVLDAAYNLHDLEFVLFVYRCSSEDPSVYEQEIAELKRLNNMDHLNFVMCLKGNNPKEAVKYLLRCDKFDEDFIENFIMRFKVEKEAYNTVDSSHLYYFLISRLYAKALSEERKYQEAALVYKRAGFYKEALDEHTLDLDWREVIKLMAVLNYDDEVKPKVLDKIADRLIEEKRVDDAVILLEHYNKDYKKTIKTLIDFKAFRQAVCLAERLSLDVELLAIMDALKNYIDHMEDNILSFRKQFKRNTERLEQVRKNREKKLMMEAAGIAVPSNDEEASDLASLLSYAPSTNSGRTHSSTSSARSRQELELQKIDLKEGGKYEDIALIRALHILYTQVFQYGGEVREICLFTPQANYVEARSLHDMLNGLQKDMKQKVNDIWPEVFIENQLTTDPVVMAILQNREDLDPKYREPPLNLMNVQWQLDMYC